MSFYPKGILGNKILEDMYTASLKSAKKIEKLHEEKTALEQELAALKSDYEAKKTEIELIKADVTKAKLDIDDIKKPKES